ncbi:serine hydrolase [Pleionea sp. CnH1-48]|uniref:serine hydrolase domain-containing protein n=1 Tax=Pleionea sp. CnH1-48 TaxID=2954494 RepID=UPI002097D6DE|nr:serine hydrolase [Pleionea sp. CnH1-48]MCO7224710.1 beta-lactamase family protein [Pleionea sp. CnH1-48]
MYLRYAIFSSILLMSLWGSALASSKGESKSWELQQLTNKVKQGDFKQITSILVNHQGSLVYEQYFNKGHIDYMNDLRSATKSINSLAVGIAKEKGHIDSVSQTMVSFFENERQWKNPSSIKNKITIEDLLTMSSLLECNDENQFSRGHEERMYIFNDWVQFVLDIPIKGFVPWEPKPEQSRYGRSFAYCTAGSFMLGAIVERATGKGMDDFLEEYLHKPMGITKVKWNYSPHGVASGAGGTRYRSRDFIKFGELLIKGGQWEGQKIVSNSWIEQSTKPRAIPREGYEYGYQWWRMKHHIDGQEEWSIAAMGNGGNYLVILPQRELVILITSEAYNTRYGHSQSREIINDYVLKALPSIKR